jgi:hypothetical protein
MIEAAEDWYVALNALDGLIQQSSARAGEIWS